MRLGDTATANVSPSLDCQQKMNGLSVPTVDSVSINVSRWKAGRQVGESNGG